MSPARTGDADERDGGIRVTIVRGGEPRDAATLEAIARAIATLDARRGPHDAGRRTDPAWSLAGRIEAVAGRRIRTHDGVTVHGGSS